MSNLGMFDISEFIAGELPHRSREHMHAGITTIRHTRNNSDGCVLSPLWYIPLPMSSDERARTSPVLNPPQSTIFAVGR